MLEIAGEIQGQQARLDDGRNDAIRPISSRYRNDASNRMRNVSRNKKNVQRYPCSIVIDFYPRALSKLGATRRNGETGNGRGSMV